jgi:ATP-binding cassette subfamily B protein
VPDHDARSHLAVLLRTARLLRPYPVRAAAALLLGLAMVGFATRLPLVLGATIDNGVVRHRPGALAAGVLAFLALALGRFACAGTRRAVGGSLGADIEFGLRNRIAGRILELDAAWHDGAASGQLLARASSDVGAVRDFLSFGLVYSVLNTLMAVIAVVQMWLLSARLTLVTLAFAPLLALTSLRYNRLAQRLFRRVQERVGELTTVVEETAAGIAVVRAFGREDTRQAAFTREAGQLLDENLAVTRLRARYGPLLALLPALSLVAVLWYGGRLAARHDITLGTLVAVNAYLAMLSVPLESVSMLSGMAQRGLAGARRVFEILDTPDGITDRPGAVGLPAPPSAVRGCRVTLEQVSFWYPGASRPALAGVSLDLEPGERAALTGDSGSGKSALAALLIRDYDPAAGRVLVDGHDVAGLGLGSLRAAVAVVPAEPVLFAATLRDNLTLGAPGAAESDIRAALADCAALGFADRLPDGLDTVLGERGTTLSGGQRQRVALARALLARPRLLILDDALSQLDAETAAAVTGHLDAALDGVTVLIMGGHPASLRLVSRVLALDAGRLVPAGRHLAAEAAS